MKKIKGGDKVERLNKEGNVEPMGCTLIDCGSADQCWGCDYDGSMCIIDVPDCPYECLVFNL